MVLIVSRSKLVLDFALTMHFFHLAVAYLYSGTLPGHTAWWIAMGVSSACATVLGTYACRWRELRPISFGSGTGAGANGSAPSGGGGCEGSHQELLAGETGGSGGAEDDLEWGYSRGRGRGRGRDEEGDYEMVAGVRRERRDD